MKNKQDTNVNMLIALPWPWNRQIRTIIHKSYQSKTELQTWATSVHVCFQSWWGLWNDCFCFYT